MFSLRALSVYLNHVSQIAGDFLFTRDFDLGAPVP